MGSPSPRKTCSPAPLYHASTAPRGATFYLSSRATYWHPTYLVCVGVYRELVESASTNQPPTAPMHRSPQRGKHQSTFLSETTLASVSSVTRTSRESPSRTPRYGGRGPIWAPPSQLSFAVRRRGQQKMPGPVATKLCWRYNTNHWVCSQR